MLNGAKCSHFSLGVYALVMETGLLSGYLYETKIYKELLLESTKPGGHFLEMTRAKS